MSRYTESSQTAITASTAIHTCAEVTPGASQGVALFSVMACSVLNATSLRAPRWQLFRATGGTPAAQTPELLNSRSSAANAAGAGNMTAEPTIAGNALLLMSFYDNTTAATSPRFQRMWSVPNPRYPIYNEPSSNSFALAISTTESSSPTRNLGFGEAAVDGFRYDWRGRRSTVAGGFAICSQSLQFQASNSTAKQINGSRQNNMTQPADWPQVIPQWNINIFGGTSPDVTVNLTGIGLAATAGNLSITGDANLSLTGNLLTATAGNPTATGGASVSPTGNLLTAASGSPSITGSANVSPTGNLLTTTAGNPSISGSANVSLSGNLLTASTGTVTVSVGGGADVTVDLTGIGLAISTGNPAISGDANVAPSGNSLAGSSGNPLISGSALVIPSGNSMSMSTGNLTLTGGANVSLSGSLLNITAGNVTVSTLGPAVVTFVTWIADDFG